jgi:alpha-tubulin suppressor-like RCC1 family protein
MYDQTSFETLPFQIDQVTTHVNAAPRKIVQITQDHGHIAALTDRGEVYEYGIGGWTKLSAIPQD